MREFRDLWRHTGGEVALLDDAYRDDHWFEGVWMAPDGREYFTLGVDVFATEAEAVGAARSFLIYEGRRLRVLERRLDNRLSFTDK